MVDAQEARARIVAAPSRQDALDYVDSLGLGIGELIALSSELGCYAHWEHTETEVKERLVWCLAANWIPGPDPGSGEARS
jgi:hypothetical protein